MSLTVTRYDPRRARHSCHVDCVLIFFPPLRLSPFPHYSCRPTTVMTDNSPRPHKRPRLDSSPPMPSSSLSSLPTSPSKSQGARLKPLPPAILLISLPTLLAHPPTHRLYIPSLCLSLCALRKCLTIPALSPEIECRAWTGLAEAGMRVIDGGLHENEDCPWASGIEAEVNVTSCFCARTGRSWYAYIQVDKALGKAVSFSPFDQLIILIHYSPCVLCLVYLDTKGRL